MSGKPTYEELQAEVDRLKKAMINAYSLLNDNERTAALVFISEALGWPTFRKGNNEKKV